MIVRYEMPAFPDMLCVKYKQIKMFKNGKCDGCATVSKCSRWILNLHFTSNLLTLVLIYQNKSSPVNGHLELVLNCCWSSFNVSADVRNVRKTKPWRPKQLSGFFRGCGCCATFTQHSWRRRAIFGPDFVGSRCNIPLTQIQCDLFATFSQIWITQNLSQASEEKRAFVPWSELKTLWNDWKMSVSGTYGQKYIFVETGGFKKLKDRKLLRLHHKKICLKAASSCNKIRILWSLKNKNSGP